MHTSPRNTARTSTCGSACINGFSRLGANELPEIREEITDLYGEPPQPVKDLMIIAEIRDRMKKLRLKKLERKDNRLRLYLGRDSIINLKDLIELVTQKYGRLYPQGIAEIPIGEENVSDEIRDILYRIA